MSTGDFSSQSIPSVRPDAVVKDSQQAAQLANLRIAMSQELAYFVPADFANSDLFFLSDMAMDFEGLEVKTKKAGEEGEEEVGESETTGPRAHRRSAFQRIQKTENTSQRFQKENSELQSRLLLILKAHIKESDTPEEIIAKVLQAYPDVSLADEALDFLLETSSGALKANILAAKKEFNDRYGMEIRAGRNMGMIARQYAQQQLGSPTALRDMYRDIISNPREAPILFEELSKEFSYQKMKAVLDFLLHSAGADLKAKGPSISRAELHNLMTETRSMQAILGIYRFFKSRMKLISSAFTRNGLPMPHKLTFELIARLFMKFLQERYPTADKVLLLAAELEISDVILAEIIIYTQMRDGVRQIAPKLYKSEQHKQDVLTAFILALEQLDKELEEGTEESSDEEESKEDE